jgi:hypothetical protein
MSQIIPPKPKGNISGAVDAELTAHADEIRRLYKRTIGDIVEIRRRVTTRKNAEYVVLCRRGSPKRLAADVFEIIVAPRRESGRKPDEIYSRIERYSAGPRLDLFGRESRNGWCVWGDESTKFDAPAPFTLPALEALS